jgi:hypothetical protein
MGKNKKYLTKTINLGEVGHPARILAEKYIEKFGKQEFSALCRKLIVIFLSDNPEFKDWKIKSLINERKELQAKIPEISDKLCANADKLEKLGVNINDL